jgi:hypothetical protein
VMAECSVKTTGCSAELLIHRQGTLRVLGAVLRDAQLLSWASGGPCGIDATAHTRLSRLATSEKRHVPAL